MADLALPNSRSIGLCVRGGHATLFGLSLRMLSPAGRIVPAVGATDLPSDGSRPADAVFQKSGPTVSVYHNLVTLTVDDARPPRAVRVTLTEPMEEVRLVRQGLARIAASPSLVAELRLDNGRYQRMIAMPQQAPRGCSDADIARLASLYKAYELARPGAPKARAERALLLAMHLIGDNYRQAAGAWLGSVRQNTTDPELRVILKNGQ